MRMTTYMMMGTPRSDVIVLTGSITPLRATMSHISEHSSMETAPQSIVAGISTRWLAVRKVIRAR